MIATALTTFTGALVSCSDSGDSGNTPILPGEGTQNPYAGDYYFAAADGEYSLAVGSSSVTLTMGGKTVTGAYVYDEASKKFTIVFSDDKDIGYATVSDYGLTLKYKNANYEFLKKETYKVSFNVDGGAAMTDADVVNGKTLQKPSDAVKEGYWFVGWYTDAECKQAYDFGAPVHGAMTLYARFVQKTEQEEFAVKYVVDGAEYATAETKGGKIYNNELPTPTKEGKTFAGWWVSDYEDANKLTYKYNENELGQDTTFYALWEEADKLYVSVSENGVSWNALPSNQNPYTLEIRDASGKQNFKTVTPETSYAIDFSEYAAGEYTIKVSVQALNTDSTAYFKYKALNKVSHFRVDDTRLLTFNEIKGAEKYIITVECGDKTHQHAQVETNTPTYNFADCAMQEGGIKFTVQAVADGYVTSEKATYSFEATLGALTGLTVDGETELVSWDAVENATEYVVEITNGGTTETKTTKDTSLSLRGMTGSFEIKVTPKARAYNSSDTQTTTFNNTRLAVPMGLRIDGATNSLVWNEVNGATGYKLTIGGKEYTTTEAKFPLTSEHFTNNRADITVRATCADASKTSLVSDTFTASVGTMSDKLTYANGMLSWQAVLGAQKYGVKVGDGAEFIVNSNQTAITFAAAGNTSIQVRCYNADGDPSVWVEMSVKVYKVKFDVSGGTSVEVLYNAEGDQYTLDALTSTREGYTFAGWYDKPSNGKKYQGALTQGAENLTVYANWTANSYKVTLNLGDFGEYNGELEQTITYDSMYELPVPSCTDATKIFAGWRTEDKDQGIQYTDLNGASVAAWRNANDTTILYASWYDIFSFEETEINGVKGWSVKKDSGIYYLSEITIPESYQGKPVIRIEADAFENCNTLTTIRIPDSVMDVFMPANGGYTSDSPFYGCTKLEKIEVYGNAAEPTYMAKNGALLRNNGVNGYTELCYVPLGIEGTFYVPDGVTAIPFSALRGTKLTKIVIPASVVRIEQSAFMNATSLTTLEFLASSTNKEEALTIADGAFIGCTAITELNLPKRIAKISYKFLDDLTKLKSVAISGNEAEDGAIAYSAENGVVFQGTTLVYFPRMKSGYYAIPSNVTTIASNAFAGATRLTEVSIHANVTLIEAEAFKGATALKNIEFKGTEHSAELTIEKKAFYNCNALEKLVLPENLVYLGEYAFGATSGKLYEVELNVGENADLQANAFADEKNTFTVQELTIGVKAKDVRIAEVFGNKLTKVKVNANNPYYTSSEDGVLFNKKMEAIVYFPASKTGKYIVPNTVTVISGYVFSAKKIESVTIPASVTTIEDYAFYNCASLNEVIFMKTAEGEAEALLSIGDYAFAACKQLVSLTVPARVTSIGEYAFANLTNLANLTFEDGTESLKIGEYAFAYYKTMTGSSQPCGTYLQEVTFPSRLKKIGQYAFDYAFSAFNSNVTADVSLVLPEGLEEIGNYAFAHNYRLLSVSLPASLQKLGAYNDATNKLTGMAVFDGCSNMATLSVAEGNTSFATQDGVLYNAAKTELYFSPKKNQGNEGAIVIPQTILKIWDNAFYQNGGILSVSFAGAVSSELTIGANMFYDCTKLESVALPVGLETIPQKAFYRCSALTSIIVPWTVKNIQPTAFDTCSKLAEIVFQATPEDETEVSLVFETCTKTTSVFNGCTALTNLALPDRTSSIGNYAFYGLKLTSVYIPKGVELIGDYAFQSNKNLTSVTFAADNEKLTTIGQYAFADCAITSVHLPKNVETIGQYAFAMSSTYTKVSPISEVILSEKLTSIGDYAFAKSQITSITFPATLKTIGKYAFSYSFLESVTFNSATDENGKTTTALTSIGDYAFYYDWRLTRIQLPASVTTIGANAFDGCVSLATVQFESIDGKASLNKVGDNAFAHTSIASFAFPETSNTITLGKALFDGCLDLTTVHLSSSVAKIDDVFQNCAELQQITVAEGNANFSTKADPNDSEKLQQILYSKDGTGIKYIYYTIEGELDLSKSGLTSLSDYVFQNQTKLTKIVLPNTLISIGQYAFKGCSSLKIVEFAKEEGKDFHLTSIGNYAFAGTPITSIVLPDSVTTLGTNVFDGCKSLTSATLSKDLKTIGTKVFNGATNLANVTLPEGMTTIGQYMFTGTALTSVTVPASTTKIDANAFQNCKALETVTFAGNKLATIGNYAFNNCTALTSFTVPDSVTSISSASVGTYMFAGCTNLVSVTLPTKMKAIPNYMFDGCTSLTSIEIPSNVTTIGTYAFRNCKSLTSIALPKITAALGNYAFSGCSALSSITFADTSTFTTIGNYAFQNCTALEEFVFPAKVTTINQYAFSGSGIKTMTLPEGITTLGDYVFKGCASLESITLGGKTEAGKDALTNVGKNLFDSCLKLKSVTLREGITKIGQYMFGGSTKAAAPALTELTLPSTVKTIDNYAFKYTKIKSLDLSGTNVTAIGTQAFEFASTTEVTLPIKCTTLGSKAFKSSSIEKIDLSHVTTFTTGSQFEDCTQLEEVTLGALVTSVGSGIFKGCTKLTKVTLSDGFNVSKLTDGASMFENCTSLTTIQLPDSLTKVPNSMFKGCKNLATIESWGDVDSIGSSAFESTALTSVSIKSVTSLGGTAFKNCASLTSVTLSKELSEIGASTFYGCAELETVDFSENEILSSIGGSAFYGCVSLKTISIPANVGKIAESAFQNSGLTRIDLSNTQVKTLTNSTSTAVSSYAKTFMGCTDLREVKLPATLTFIGGYVFQDCTSLQFVNLPDGITLIGRSAFENTALTSVALPEKLETLGEGAFANAPVAFYTISSENENYKAINGSLFKADGTMVLYSASLVTDGVLYLPEGCTSVVEGNSSAKVSPYGSNIEEIVFPSTFETISKYAFNYMTSLKKLTVPASVTSIAEGAFQYCTSLEEVIFEDGEDELSLGNYMFRYCDQLTSVTFSSRVKTIGNSMFGGGTGNCKKLKNITISEGVEAIGDYAFQGIALESITLPSTLTTIGKYAFKGTSLTTIDLKNVETIGDYAFQNSLLETVVLPESVTKVGASAFDNTKITSVTLPATVTSWGSGVFQNNESLTSVTLPEGLKEIPASAFYGCAALTNVTLPQSLTMIGASSFKNTGLTSVDIPEAVTSIGASAFQNVQITSVTLPTTVTSWGMWAFANNALLTEVILPEGLKTVPLYVFTDCAALTSVTLPNSITEIGSNAFQNTGLTEIVLPESVTKVDNYAFDNTQITSLVLPDSITSLGTGAFQNNAMLKSVTLSDGLETIPSSAFKYCTKLTSVEIGDNVGEIASYAFQYCAALNHVTLGVSVQTIGSMAFSGCNNLVEVYNRSRFFSIEIGATTNGYIGQHAKNVYTPKKGSSKLMQTGDFYVYVDGEEKLLVSYVGVARDIVIPEGVTKIEKEVFKDNLDIATVKLSDSVTEIGSSAFSGCTYLYKITLGKGLTTIGASAFNNCYKLVEICNDSDLELTIGATANGYIAYYAKNIYTSTSGASKLIAEGDFVLYVDGDEKVLVNYLGSAKNVVIPEGVTAIGSYAFFNAEGVVSITATGNTIKSVGDHAFEWNKSALCTLKSIDLGTAVETIGVSAFSCYSVSYATLESVTFGDNLKTIGESAFKYQTKIAEIVLPASVETVGANAFQSWVATQTVKVAATKAEVTANKNWSSTWLGSSAKVTVEYDSLNAEESEA